MADHQPPDERFEQDSSEDPTLGLEKVREHEPPDDPEIPGYRTIRLLGQGGMGRVYLAEDEFLDRQVAIKFISEALPREAEPIARFQREAKAMAAIEHPNIVHIYTYGIAVDRPYFVMQFIDGETLAQRNAHRGTASVEDAVHFGAQITSALEAAWARNIVHRDLKPANVLVDSDGHAHVADFGLAMAIRSTFDPSREDSGRVVGTPLYMAPEQARGDDVDFRADLYSLGLILYEMLSGEVPFGDLQRRQLLSARAREPIPTIRLKRPDLPIELERVIAWLTMPDPELRPDSHEGVSRQLRAMQEMYSSDRERLASRGDPVSPRASRGVPVPRRPTSSAESARVTPTPAGSKQATVLTVQIAALDEHREGRGGGETAAASSGVLDRVRDLVEARGGTVQSAEACTLTATFGFPTAFEGSPVAAINAAIAARDLLRSVGSSDEPSSPAAFRIGIETGRVTRMAGEGPLEANRPVDGGALEVATALTTAARDNQIVVGRNTRRLTDGLFEFTEWGPVRDPGVGADVEASELISDRESEGRVGEGQRKIVSSKLVGRDHELDRLGLHVLGLLNGRGGVVSLVGPAGIGKSRLYSELKRTYSNRSVAFLEGRSISTGQALSFHPLIDMLKKWTRISDQDTNAVALHKLQTAIESIHHDDADEVFPFIATVMGLKLSGSHAERMRGIEGHNLRQLIFRSIRSLLVAASRHRPMVLVLEDLHWADTTSLEFLESLYGLVIDHRILFINIYRPGFDDSTEPLADVLDGEFSAFHERIQLHPLQPTDCAELLSDLLHTSDVPTPIKQSIIDKGDGNPFFLEEIIQSLLDDEKISIVRGTVVGAETFESLDVPETVQDVLEARLDRLDELDRRVIRIASVFGRTFPYSVMTDVARDVDSLDDRLLYLENIGMIKRRQYLGQLAFSFRHALMQDVAYKGLLEDDRRALHLMIARSIEEIFSEREAEFYGLLAYHFCAAQDVDKSEEYLIKAGQEAQQSAGSSEALKLFEKALMLYAHRRESEAHRATITRLETNVALAHYSRGSYGEAVECFRKVLPAYGIRPPEDETALVLKFLGSFGSFLLTVHFPALRFKRQPQSIDSEGLGLYYSKLAALAHHNPKRFFLESFILADRLARFDLSAVENGVAMFVSAGNLLSWTGASFYLSSKVLSLLEAYIDQEDPKALISFSAAKVTHEFLAGDWSRGEYDDQLVSTAMSLGEVFLASNYVIFHGRMALEMGQLDLTNELVEKLNRLGVEFDHSYPPALHVYLHAKMLLKIRQLPEVVKECESGRTEAEAASLDTVVFGLEALKARALAYMGDLEAADSLLRRVSGVNLGRTLPKSYVGDFLISRCTVDVMELERVVAQREASMRSDVVRRAERSAVRLLKNSAKVASHVVEAERLSGMVCWLKGRHHHAARHWRRGIAVGERLGAKLDLSRLYKEVGIRMRSIGSSERGWMQESSKEYLDRARAMFEEMGLEWDLAELAEDSGESDAVRRLQPRE